MESFNSVGTYAGIGSRDTPPTILLIMNKIGLYLESLGFLLRSGGAIGADQAFEKGVSRKEIFLAQDATLAAANLSKLFHPAWDRLDNYSQKLHARNAMILLGRNLDKPVDFVVCWTKDAKMIGGTAQALRMAEARNIKVFNLARESDLEDLRNYVRSVKGAQNGLKYVKGDATEVPSGTYLLHSCNAQGNWGAGFAKVLKEKFYEAYLDQYEFAISKNALGDYRVYRSDVNIISIFNSKGFGANKSTEAEILTLTDQIIRDLIKNEGIKEISMPKINAGFFRVPWPKTEAILLKISEDFGVKFTIYIN